MPFLAFSPKVSGWHGETELSPSISFINYHMFQIYPPQGKGESSLLGLNFQQSVGWGRLGYAREREFGFREMQ